MRELDADLFTSSQRWALTGIAVYVDGEGDDFAAHHVAVALEHLAKAYLCSLHPALIGADDFDTMLNLCGLENLASRPIENVRTISFDVACQRVSKVLRAKFPYVKEQLAPLVNVRNGVAHAGVWQQSEIKRSLSYAIRLIDSISAALGKGRSEFWCQYEQLTSTMLNDLKDEEKFRYERKLALAREQFRVRFSEMAPAVVLEAWIVYSSGRPPHEEHDEEYVCPVCGQDGWLGGLVQLEKLTLPGDEGEEDEEVVGKFFYPDSFDCGICGLRLDAREVLFAGLPHDMDLGEASAEDLVAFGSD